MPTGARTSWYTPGAGSLPRRRGTRGLLGRAGMHPPPPPMSSLLRARTKAALQRAAPQSHRRRFGMQQHPKSELQGWGAPGARRGGWDALPRRAVPTPACPGMCRPHGDGRSMSRWPHVPAWGRAHTSGGGGDEQHPTPQGLSPCPPPRDSLLRHRRLLPPVHGGDLSPGHGSPNTQPWLCHTGGRPTLGSKQRRFPGGRRRGGSQAQPVLLPPPPPQGQVSPVLPAPLVCAAAAERHASRPRPPPPPPPLRRRPRRAAAIPRHAGEGNIARCTRESFVEVPAGMGTPASPAESQAEVPAWHGGPWPPATPA